MRVAILTKDLFMSVRLGEALKKAGHEVVAPSDAPAVAFVDLGPTGAATPGEGIREMKARGVYVVAFGPHADVASLAAARDAGADIVTSNGQALTDPVRLVAKLTRNRQA